MTVKFLCNLDGGLIICIRTMLSTPLDTLISLVLFNSYNRLRHFIRMATFAGQVLFERKNALCGKCGTNGVIITTQCVFSENALHYGEFHVFRCVEESVHIPTRIHKCRIKCRNSLSNQLSSTSLTRGS